MKARSRHLPIVVTLLALGIAMTLAGSLQAEPAATREVVHAVASMATSEAARAEEFRPPTGELAHADPTAEAPAPKSAIVSLVAVGDVMLGRTIGQRALAAGAGVVFDERIRSVLHDADITVGNLECAVAEGGEAQAKGYTFRAPAAALGALEAAGFDLVSLANNHSLDYGRDAVIETIANLSRYGVQAAGAGGDIAQAQSARVIQRAGLKIAFVSLVDVPGEGSGFSRQTWEADSTRPGVAWADRQTVTASVRAAAANADVVVVMLHFGVEYAANPSATQRQLAHAAIDAGAALVVGSHPHVLQEVEEYGGGVIAYSLGNFVFDGFSGTSNDSAILEVSLTERGVTRWELHSVKIIDDGLPRLRQE